MLVIGIGYSYFAFTTDATENMNNFNAIQIVIPIVINYTCYNYNAKETYQDSIQK